MIINNSRQSHCDLEIGDIVSFGDYQILPGPA
jgi:hypothetical protein